MDHLLYPVLLGLTIRIREKDNSSPGLCNPQIASSRRTLIALLKNSEAIPPNPFQPSVRRSIINDDDFITPFGLLSLQGVVAY